jgi:hypothetical protein
VKTIRIISLISLLALASIASAQIIKSTPQTVQVNYNVAESITISVSGGPVTLSSSGVSNAVTVTGSYVLLAANHASGVKAIVIPPSQSAALSSGLFNVPASNILVQENGGSFSACNQADVDNINGGSGTCAPATLLTQNQLTTTPTGSLPSSTFAFEFGAAGPPIQAGNYTGTFTILVYALWLGDAVTGRESRRLPPSLFYFTILGGIMQNFLKLKLFIGLLFTAVAVSAQVSVSPLVAVAAKHASDQMTVTNGGITPVAVTLDARALTFVDGKMVITPLGKDIQVKLHETSARLEPNSAHIFDYDLKCLQHCAVVIVATVTPILPKPKTADDGEVHAGVKINYAFAETVYVCPKVKGCREGFKEMWNIQ